MKAYIWLKQHFCKHHYVKHWSKEKKKYLLRCAKCNKELLL